MLASGEQASDRLQAGKRHRWCLLLDCETHDVSDHDIAAERFGAPLSPRMRNTVAHELAHSLAFRPTEFGVEFPRHFNSQQSKQQFVNAIEKQTEMLSPLLLLPDALLDRVFSPEKETVSIRELCAAMHGAGVSRYVFVNRFSLLKLVDPKRLRARSCLSNFAIGIGEWISERDANLKIWPLFSNFEGGKVPGFLFQLQRRIPLVTKSLFSDPSFQLCGGDCDTTEVTVPAGTPHNPDSFRLPIRFAVEIGQRNCGAEFLFLVHSTISK
jgi:hypothetical protein